MGGQWSALSPTSSAEHSEMSQTVHQLGHFPKTEEQAKAEYINILKEMEYRSVRAAKMAYEHSDEFEKNHIFLAKLVASLTGLSTIGLQINGRPMGRPFYFRAGSFSLAAASIVGIGFYQSFDTLLPLYHRKHVAYNEAGAHWQALELRIRFERATTLERNLSLKDLREKGLEYADERRRICEIARPTIKMHETYEEDSSKIVEIKKKLLEAIECYFGYFGVVKDSTAGQTVPTPED